MKIANKKIRRKHVKKALIIGVYAFTALGMVVWTVAPGFGS